MRIDFLKWFSKRIKENALMEVSFSTGFKKVFAQIL